MTQIESLPIPTFLSQFYLNLISWTVFISTYLSFISTLSREQFLSQLFSVLSQLYLVNNFYLNFFQFYLNLISCLPFYLSFISTLSRAYLFISVLSQCYLVPTFLSQFYLNLSFYLTLFHFSSNECFWVTAFDGRNETVLKLLQVLQNGLRLHWISSPWRHSVE